MNLESIERSSASAVFGTPADLGRGLAMGLGVGIFAAISTYIRYSRPLLFVQRHGDPALVSAACLGGALLAGALFGLLRPMTRKLPVAGAIAFLGGLPVVIALDATRNTPQHPLGVIHWVQDIAFTSVFAVGAAVLYRRRTSART